MITPTLLTVLGSVRLFCLHLSEPLWSYKLVHLNSALREHQTYLYQTVFSDSTLREYVHDLTIS